MHIKAGWYHLIALSIVIVWGTTFVSTKILLRHGLAPGDIFFYRFLLAYVGIRFFERRQLFADSFKDELLLMLTGMTGGSFYFIAENTALEITQASNVALLVSTAPVLTVILSHRLLKAERLNRYRYLWQGSLLALAGVVLVAFNGHFILRLHPLGDLLSLLAALLWAVYTILLKRLGSRYSTLFITRKVFFYGIVTLLPVFLYRPLNMATDVLMQPVVWGNLLYLGVAASLLCYSLWNTVVKKLGAVRTTNYVYIIPAVTLLTSMIVLDETVTPVALAGALLIPTGVMLAGRQK